MQSTAGGGGRDLNRVNDGGGGGGGGGGLARFRSAPASWLEALLEDDDPLKPPLHHSAGGGLTQLLTAGTGTSDHTPTATSNSNSNIRAASVSAVRVSSSYDIPSAYSGFLDLSEGVHHHHHSDNLSFHRQNSSPADFLNDQHVDGFVSGFGIPASYDYLGSSSSPADASTSGKRIRAHDSVKSPKFIGHLEGEQSGHMQAGPNGLFDMEMEKLLEDSVPCRVRAKRGCATHPRSIAERVRRTRISDRIRKLQELVPNMDKLADGSALNERDENFQLGIINYNASLRSMFHLALHFQSANKYRRYVRRGSRVCQVSPERYSGAHGTSEEMQMYY